MSTAPLLLLATPHWRRRKLTLALLAALWLRLSPPAVTGSLHTWLRGSNVASGTTWQLMLASLLPQATSVAAQALWWLVWLPMWMHVGVLICWPHTRCLAGE